jgi:hypothetical protein
MLPNHFGVRWAQVWVNASGAKNVKQNQQTKRRAVPATARQWRPAGAARSGAGGSRYIQLPEILGIARRGGRLDRGEADRVDNFSVALVFSAKSFSGLSGGGAERAAEEPPRRRERSAEGAETTFRLPVGDCFIVSGVVSALFPIVRALFINGFRSFPFYCFRVVSKCSGNNGFFSGEATANLRRKRYGLRRRAPVGTC